MNLAVGLLTALCGGVLGALATWRWARWRMHEAIAANTTASEATIALDLQQAAEQERQRIFADLHDDIGAKLVTLIHRLDDAADADLARAALQDLRDVVSRLHIGPITLLEALAQIREEAEQRLELAHCGLDWQQPPALPDPPLDEAQALHLFRISREAITNALRHAHPRQLRLRIRAAAAVLLLDVTDDGPGMGAAQPQGRGTQSMRQRAEALHGRIDWTLGTEGGTKVVLQFPLPAAGRHLSN